jgi:hypothetical protein
MNWDLLFIILISITILVLLSLAISYIATLNDSLVDAIYGGIVVGFIIMLIILKNYHEGLNAMKWVILAFVIIMFIVMLVDWVLRHVVKPIFDSRIVILLTGTIIGILLMCFTLVYVLMSTVTEEDFEDLNIQ